MRPIKLLKRFLLAIALLFVIGLVLVQYPSLFIKKVGEYGAFKIYSNSEIDINTDVTGILDSVQSLLNKSEFADASNEFKLYFIRATFYEKLLRSFGMKNIAFSKFEKHIYSATPNFKEGKLSRNNNQYEWLDLVQVISHEGVHTQMYKDYYGWIKMKTPFWINEGYAEYISYQPIRERNKYDLKSLLSKLENSGEFWLETEYKSMTPRDYVMSRLLMEYLIDVKKMGIREIIEDESLVPDEIYEEIKAYYQ